VHCDDQFVPFPVTQIADSRPQLTADQAKRYDYLEVLKTVGKAGQEMIDPWDPLKDVLAKNSQLPVDYVVDPAAQENGKTVFHRVQAAINQAVIDSGSLVLRAQHKARIYILLKPGVYRELLYVPATPIPITLYSNDSNAANTKISASLHAALLGSAYVARFGAQFSGLDEAILDMFNSLKERPVVGTSGTAIAWIKSNGFQAKNMTFENAYNKEKVEPGVECPNSTCGATAGTAPAVVVHHQAVALMLDGADKVQFENVRVLGFQDTLYLKSPEIAKTVRSFFNKSYIEGNVDFIFGDTTAYFYQSEIKSLGDRSTSYVTAPNTNYKSKYGFVFNQCKFTHDGSANALAGQFYLGRQWFHTQKCTPYGRVNTPGYSCTLGLIDGYAAPIGTVSKTVLETVGKSVILNSVIGAHIHKTHPWSDWNKNGTLPYRPAQYSSNDYWSNLLNAGIDPVSQLGYSAKPSPADVFLAEFNNTNE
jgi:polygalacturonase